VDLTVYGFGATILMNADSKMRVRLYQPPGSPPQHTTLDKLSFGHRHKSAAHFCATQVASYNKEHLHWTAIALVASQDGALSVFTIAGAEVAIARPYSLRGRLGG
jgi:hypothetical protein